MLTVGLYKSREEWFNKGEMIELCTIVRLLSLRIGSLD
jgi:hypothetical protein